MPDMKKVIDFLQHISLYAYEYSDANYEILGYPYLEAERIADDTLALLKEQEAVVRCKDCEHRISCTIYLEAAEAENEDWFCADGEREA